ncbi:MAG TPA: hypothetical protein VGU45_12540, partial [Microvirga sp.]|nr:hypothetical protein [Microvirga sp.]
MSNIRVWSPRRGSHEREPDLARCRAAVWQSEGNWGRSYQCQRKPKVFRCVEGVEGEVGFC